MNLAARKIRLLMELRRAGISDTRVLSAIERVPREAFTPEAFHDQAYENRALPIACGQTVSQPEVVAMMTQALEPDPSLRVLEIGTGSGYQTAILAHLFRRVYTIERHKPLLAEAEAVLERLGIRNVTAMEGDGWKGWPAQAPFERIIVTAAAEEMPRTLAGQLAEGGIMVLPIGHDSHDQVLMKVRRRGEELDKEVLAPVRFVPLVHGLPPGREAKAAGRRGDESE